MKTNTAFIINDQTVKNMQLSGAMFTAKGFTNVLSCNTALRRKVIPQYTTFNAMSEKNGSELWHVVAEDAAALKEVREILATQSDFILKAIEKIFNVTKLSAVGTISINLRAIIDAVRKVTGAENAIAIQFLTSVIVGALNPFGIVDEHLPVDVMIERKYTRDLTLDHIVDELVEAALVVEIQQIFKNYIVRVKRRLDESANSRFVLHGYGDYFIELSRDLMRSIDLTLYQREALFNFFDVFSHAVVNDGVALVSSAVKTVLTVPAHQHKAFSDLKKNATLARLCSARYNSELIPALTEQQITQTAMEIYNGLYNLRTIEVYQVKDSHVYLVDGIKDNSVANSLPMLSSIRDARGGTTNIMNFRVHNSLYAGKAYNETDLIRCDTEAAAITPTLSSSLVNKLITANWLSDQRNRFQRLLNENPLISSVAVTVENVNYSELADTALMVAPVIFSVEDSQIIDSEELEPMLTWKADVVQSISGSKRVVRAVLSLGMNDKRLSLRRFNLASLYTADLAVAIYNSMDATSENRKIFFDDDLMAIKQQFHGVIDVKFVNPLQLTFKFHDLVTNNSDGQVLISEEHSLVGGAGSVPLHCGQLVGGEWAELSRNINEAAAKLNTKGARAPRIDRETYMRALYTVISEWYNNDNALKAMYYRAISTLQAINSDHQLGNQLVYDGYIRASVLFQVAMTVISFYSVASGGEAVSSSLAGLHRDTMTDALSILPH